MASDVPKVIRKLLREYQSLSIIADGKRIKCSLTGHEIPCNEAAINSYVSGKKFMRLNAIQNPKFDPDLYKQHVVPSNKRHHENHLFCQLTLRHLNKEPHHFERHVKGKRFQKALKKWEECQKTGEKFVPRGQQKRRKDSDSEGEGKKHSWGSDSESDAIEDNLSDLYPDEAGSDDQTSVVGFDEMDTANKPSTSKSQSSLQNQQKRGKKRKNKVSAKPEGLPKKKSKKFEKKSAKCGKKPFMKQFKSKQ